MPFSNKSQCKNILYIRNFKYAHLTPIFQIHKINLVFSTCPHKYKWILSTDKPVLNESFQDFWCTKINNHLICFEKKKKNIYQKIPHKQHDFLALNMYLSSFCKKSHEKYTFLSKNFEKKSYKNWANVKDCYCRLPRGN